jgi:acetyl-CoA synthetase
VNRITSLVQSAQTNIEVWHLISKKGLKNTDPFAVHLFIFTLLFPHWREQPETAPAWIPEKEILCSTHLFHFMSELNIHEVKTFHQWSTDHYATFWQQMLKKLCIVFKNQPAHICDLSQGIELPRWLPGASLNIVDSCFTAKSTATAIIYADKNNIICSLSYENLHLLAKRIANSLIKAGYKQGDAIAIAMPMQVETVAIYLGILMMGGVVISIADSFSSTEMATRLKITQAKVIFTQDILYWSSKKFPLYEKVRSTEIEKIIVIPYDDISFFNLRPQDQYWNDFLDVSTHFDSTACEPMSACHILFSSGTTTEPKAISWNHTTAIKAASDAYLHHNIYPGDVLCWPTNLGWMMGPWLIFAAFINQATLALYTETPKDRRFGEFIQNAKVTMLGVVPTLVSHWRQTQCMEKLDWHAIKAFSSTGECSNAEDMLYLMSLAGYKPIIEYCGGTEIGGAYLSSTLLQNNYPTLFSTPAMGMAITIIDEQGKTTAEGEVALIPPSIGLSTELLNANHHQIYYENMPKTLDNKILRRHGDQMKQLPNGYYCILGRADDAINLGGIKTSAAEIERVLIGIPHIKEVAAIAVSPLNKGPSQLVIYAATETHLDKQRILKNMQKRINDFLNPLYKIHDLVLVNELPKTASNKIMRRMLRKQYHDTLLNI